ncbi:TetR/AcrR family transcriptional regulator [Mesorhizobium sp. WSM3876]|uniref:TetR/AcrR family transcriptional regulator n=1 Tax=Mesorhizobium sp. WSM3876 TaxID=422277 RepID=UPI000BB049BF|nr:TetR/AcrR family transcriptional regulator [Mesorhizobium sp. WSM3876]PBB86844.1 TetR family transcriptional regulator [Mesorhizobium sp. WSM3876]
MSLPAQVQLARDELRRHLDKFDWAGQTARRREILQTFLKLATTEGYSSVTMRRLAKAIGVKASSIYFHFPAGRDEIVTESMRWHYYEWGSAFLEAVDQCDGANEIWDAMVRVHLSRQLSLPESDLWDILVAMDRIGGFLPTEIREEIGYWLQLFPRMYEAAAYEMGYRNCETAVHVVIAVLDSATSWCRWSGDERDLGDQVEHAIAVSRALLSSQSDIAEATTSTTKRSRR